MMEFRRGGETAIVVLHEIYGINRHMIGVCEAYHAEGYDVYCPNLNGTATAFDYFRQEEAYAFFIERGGFALGESLVLPLLEELRPRYRKVVLAGFSIGATLAWICAGKGLCDAMIGYYGSRIRDYLHSVPHGPTLLIFARQEVSFSPPNVVATLADTPGISAHILDGSHGFCDPFAPSFHSASARKAQALSQEFLETLHGMKRNPSETGGG